VVDSLGTSCFSRTQFNESFMLMFTSFMLVVRTKINNTVFLPFESFYFFTLTFVHLYLYIHEIFRLYKSASVDGSHSETTLCLICLHRIDRTPVTKRVFPQSTIRIAQRGRGGEGSTECSSLHDVVWSHLFVAVERERRRAVMFINIYSSR